MIPSPTNLQYPPGEGAEGFTFTSERGVRRFLFRARQLEGAEIQQEKEADSWKRT
jgi:hypothetical protein